MLSLTSLFVGLSLLSWTVSTMALNIPSNAESAPQAILSFSKSFEIVSSSLFSDYQLRLTEPHICDTTVKSFSGYLDISQSKHLFFWFFEARHDPKNAPLMLWLNGGPGSSSIGAGLMFENGPCWVNPQGNDTVWNPYSWNEKVNIIYLEEPAGTGYSYIEDDSGVTTLADLAVDVHAFLQLFIHRFPDYAARPFHIAAESWGGHYGPHIANYIHQKNEELDLTPRVGQAKINLASVILANGLTDPLTQFSTIEKYLCSDAPYPPYKPNDKVCVGLRLGIPSCLRMIEACYKYQTQTVCSAASAYCWPTYFSAPLFPALTGKNPYDLRQNCTDMGDNLCYDDLAGVHNFLNLTETKLALGVDPDFNFQLTNTTVNQAFYSSGQAVHNSAALLPELVNSGVRLLAYAGDTDGLCNYQGIELWMERLDHRFHVEFGLSSPSPWRTEKTGYFAGTTRSAGIGAGNVTFVRIFDAGHLAPHDQPEASLDLITRWIDNVPFGV